MGVSMSTERRGLRWLHLSDLHLRGDDAYEQDVVLGALVRSFEDGEPLADLRPDVVFCTGDIARSGKAEEYALAFGFLDALASVTNLAKDRIFLVPGNHDVDRTKVSRRFHLDLGTRESADSFFGPDADALEDRSTAWRRFAAYADFQNRYTGSALTPATPYTVSRFTERGVTVGVVGLNSAWLATTDDVKGQLVVGERLVRAALRAVAEGGPPDLLVALLHHPLDWLADFDRRAVEDLLFDTCDLVLYGHLHTEHPWAVTTRHGHVGLCGAGAAFQGRDPRWPDTAYLGERHGDDAHIRGIRWFDQGGGIWAPDPALGPRSGGVVRLPLRVRAPARPAPAALPAPSGDGLDRARYLRHVKLTCGHVILVGLLKEKAAPSVPIDSVYVSLKATWPAQDGVAGRAAARARADEATAGRGEPDERRLLRAHLELALGGRAVADRDDPGPPDEAVREALALHLGLAGAPASAASGAPLQDYAWKRLLHAARARGAVAPDSRPDGPDDGRAGAPLDGRGWDGRDWMVEALRTVDIDVALRFAGQHLLVIGDPGSGKTTQLKHVAVALADAHDGAPERARAMGFGEPFPLPVFVELRRFGAWLAGRPAVELDVPHAGLLVAYLDEVLRPFSGAAGWVGPLLEDGRVAVLLDGLDEVADERLRETASRVVHDFVDRFGRCRFTLATRPSGLGGGVRPALRDLAECVVQPLEPPQVERFVRAWYRALILDPTLADEKTGDLVARIAAAPDVAALATSPILLTVVAIVHHTLGRLPERRADLYEHAVAAMAGRWDETRQIGVPDGCPSLTLAQKQSVFQELAWATHGGGAGAATAGGDRAGSIDRADALRSVRDALGSAAAASCVDDEVGRDLLEHIADRSGLVVPDGPRSYRFRHLQFQEFLAARRICHRDPAAEEALGRHLGESWWREVIRLAPAYKALGGEADALRLLDGLFRQARERDVPAAARVAAFGVVAEAVLDLREYKLRDLDALAARYAPDLARLVEDPSGDGDLGNRIAMAEVLGWAGDPRLAPERRWVEVPSGRFWRGTKTGGYPSERPAGWVHVPDFAIGRWPVTVGELRPFVEGGGYEDEALWSPAGWRWRVGDERGDRDERPASGVVESPEGWKAQLDRSPNHPVAGVSWFEAEAYGRWCSQAPADGGTRWIVRLPSEAEWEKAARGGEVLAEGRKNEQPRREYPWGDDWDRGRANSFALEIDRATPVGIFPAGHGPYGTWDQAGNVFEWCADEWHPNYERAPTDGRAWLDGPRGSRRVLRGGSFDIDTKWLRAAYRVGVGPGGRGGGAGFRCVRVPAAGMGP